MLPAHDLEQAVDVDRLHQVMFEPGLVCTPAIFFLSVSSERQQPQRIARGRFHTGSDALADRVVQTSLLLECGVYLAEAVVIGSTLFVEEHLDRAETLVEGLEELATVLLREQRLHSCLREVLLINGVSDS